MTSFNLNDVVIIQSEGFASEYSNHIGIVTVPDQGLFIRVQLKEDHTDYQPLFFPDELIKIGTL